MHPRDVQDLDAVGLVSQCNRVGAYLAGGNKLARLGEVVRLGLGLG